MGRIPSGIKDRRLHRGRTICGDASALAPCTRFDTSLQFTAEQARSKVSSASSLCEAAGKKIPLSRDRFAKRGVIMRGNARAFANSIGLPELCSGIDARM